MKRGGERPFLNLRKGRGKEEHFWNPLWEQIRLRNFREQKLDQRHPFLHFSLPSCSLSLDHLLAYILLPGNKSQLKVDCKAVKQHYDEQRVTPMHFFLIWWLRQGFWYWAGEGGSYKSLLMSGVTASLAFEMMLSPSAPFFRLKPMAFIAYWKCPVTGSSLPWESLQWNGAALKKKKMGKRCFHRESKSLFEIMQSDCFWFCLLS